MKLILKFLISIVCLFVAPHSTLAQVTFDGCRDIRGFPVASIMDYSFNESVLQIP